MEIILAIHEAARLSLTIAWQQVFNKNTSYHGRYRDKIFTIRRLARVAGVLHPNASETVVRLENLDVVQIQPIGRSHQVTLNKKSHVLGKIVEPMLMTEEQTFDQMINSFKIHLSTKR